jgi:hypothetical protein
VGHGFASVNRRAKSRAASPEWRAEKVDLGSLPDCCAVATDLRPFAIPLAERVLYKTV